MGRDTGYKPGWKPMLIWTRRRARVLVGSGAATGQNGAKIRPILNVFCPELAMDLSPGF
jgi:hypothetical protein